MPPKDTGQSTGSTEGDISRRRSGTPQPRMGMDLTGSSLTDTNTMRPEMQIAAGVARRVGEQLARNLEPDSSLGKRPYEETDLPDEANLPEEKGPQEKRPRLDEGKEAKVRFDAEALRDEYYKKSSLKIDEFKEKEEEWKLQERNIKDLLNMIDYDSDMSEGESEQVDRVRANIKDISTRAMETINAHGVSESMEETKRAFERAKELKLPENDEEMQLFKKDLIEMAGIWDNFTEEEISIYQTFLDLRSPEISKLETHAIKDEEPQEAAISRRSWLPPDLDAVLHNLPDFQVDYDEESRPRAEAAPQRAELYGTSSDAPPPRLEAALDVEIKMNATLDKIKQTIDSENFEENKDYITQHITDLQKLSKDVFRQFVSLVEAKYNKDESWAPLMELTQTISQTDTNQPHGMPRDAETAPRRTEFSPPKVKQAVKENMNSNLSKIEGYIDSGRFEKKKDEEIKPYITMIKTRNIDNFNHFVGLVKAGGLPLDCGW